MAKKSSDDATAAVEPKASGRRKSTTKIEIPATPATGAEQAKSATPAAVIAPDAIARRAYELWQEGHPGGEWDHWIEAERQLRDGK
jgi:hypothetical protein